MNKALLKEVLIEQDQKWRSWASGVPREKLEEVQRYLDTPHAVIVSGIRRTGKSTLLAQILQKHYAQDIYFLNLEDERLLDFEVKDFNLLYELFVELYGERKVFFLDEIQNVPKWELFVRRMQDKGFKFFITGSNASLLSKELATKLTGRCVVIELLPFSFKEFLQFKKYNYTEVALLDTLQRGLLKNYFQEYLKNGGMPEYLHYQDSYILKRTYEDILYRDIMARYEIREIKALRELGLFLFSKISCQVSYNKIKSNLQLGSVNTVKNYIDYLENSFLIFPVNRFSYSIKQQNIANKKIYAIDNGVAEAVAFGFSSDHGKYLENLVFLELKRHGREIFYYKTENNLEVDFLIRKGKNISELIQVAFELHVTETREREVRALLEAMRELNIKEGLILTLDHSEIIEQDGKKIIVKPVYQWLLECNYLEKNA